MYAIQYLNQFDCSISAQFNSYFIQICLSNTYTTLARPILANATHTTTIPNSRKFPEISIEYTREFKVATLAVLMI